jgi:arabinofuranan 3-O-arabinosyltransferase
VDAIGPMRKLRLLAPPVAALALVPLAVRVHYPMDFGLAFDAGRLAWASGHPEPLGTWTGTPFLALVMAAVTQVAPLEAATLVMLAANLVLWGGLLAAVWYRLQDLVPSRWWWSTLGAAAVFAPAISNIFWMQLTLIVFAMTLGGVALTGRRNLAAGLLLGAALALKPILILLPFAFLLHRASRRAGVVAVAVAAVLSAIGLAFLAWRAADLSVVNPIAYLAQFLSKGRGPDYACVPENYSPSALLCRFGVPGSTTLTVAVAAAVLATGWLVIRRLRDVPDAKWELFAGAGLLSPMLGPIGWAVYQVLLAPLMLLLAYQFSANRAPLFLWLNLGVVFLLTMLVWDPLESLARTPVPVLVVSYTLGQFAQYYLLLLWVQWTRMRSANTTRAAGTENDAQAG